MASEAPNLNDPRFTAALDLIRRAGASEVQIRYSGKPTEQDGPPEYDANDPVPVFWMVGAELRGRGGHVGFEVAAAMHPVTAALRFLDLIIDGAQCVHCKRPTGVTDHWESPMPLDQAICWYVFDPENETYRRSCEGEAKVARNEPCPCGSGKKFKHCHGSPINA